MMESEEEIFGPTFFFIDLKVFDLLPAPSLSLDRDRDPNFP